jgi:DNA-binding LacI/PurR family transcriptional regulator
MLIQRIQGSEAKPRDVRIGYELIVRESSSPSPRRAGQHV